MGDEDRGRDLPQRVRGAARTGPPPSAPSSSSRALSEELRQRIEAAVKAERAEQVSHDVTVSCDRVMCAALEAHGSPLRNLVVLGPTSRADPVPSVVLVETAAVRDMFGSSLATAWAPAVLASFGSGTAGITVRVIAPHGLLAYQNLLSADLAARKEAGAGLLGDSQITVSAVARNQLASGQVDSRLLLPLASLAGQQPVNIVKFWNTGPGASAGIPLPRQPHSGCSVLRDPYEQRDGLGYLRSSGCGQMKGEGKA
jgi:hypothetical protein